MFFGLQIAVAVVIVHDDQRACAGGKQRNGLLDPAPLRHAGGRRCRHRLLPLANEQDAGHVHVSSLLCLCYHFPAITERKNPLFLI